MGSQYFTDYTASKSLLHLYPSLVLNLSPLSYLSANTYK